MSLAGAVALVAELGELGVELAVDGDELFYRPAGHVDEGLARRLSEHRLDVVDILRGAAGRRGAAPGIVEVVTKDDSVPIFGEWEGTCYCCGSDSYWRLRSPGCDWVCSVCHPPGPPPDQIEWRDGVTDAGARPSAAQRLEREIDEVQTSADPGVAAGIDRDAWRERFEERAAIHEYDGGLPREEAEELALQATVLALRERLGLEATAAATAGEVERG